eukprot:11721408-Prorocentrum_lima.AAC.1
MTSSLVGSEMCIRDSMGAVRCCYIARTWQRRWGRVRACRVSSGEIDQLPVSYTHLTLPTICSV